jgi:hypothetical protein
MAAWVNILERIVERVRIPIQRLRLARARHNGIRAHEPPKRRVALRGARGNRSVVCGAEARLLALLCEAEVRRNAALLTPL